MVSLVDDITRELVDKQVDNFVERNASSLVRKNPREVIQMWLDWQFSRYVVDEQEDAFYVNDLKTKSIVAYIAKKDPKAYQHAHKIREDLNANEYDGDIQITGNSALDDLIKSLNDDGDYYTVEDAINDLANDDDE